MSLVSSARPQRQNPANGTPGRSSRWTKSPRFGQNQTRRGQEPGFAVEGGWQQTLFWPDEEVWRRQQGPSGKTLQMARQVGPVDGSNALGLVEIGPGGAENRALLSGEGGSRPPFGQMKESGAVSEAPAAKRCKWGAG